MREPLTRQDIINITSEVTGISVEGIMGSRRYREYSEARFIAIYFIRDKFNDTISGIGRLFSRDHSTIIHAIETTKDLIVLNRTFKTKFNSVKMRIDEIEIKKSFSKIDCDMLIGNISM